MRLIDADLLEPDADYDDGEFLAYSKRQIEEAPTVAEVSNKKALYECDPEKNTGCAKTECYINGGECYLTQHAEYAKEEPDTRGEQDG